ncbi:DUF6284 family protein [Kineosporia babensis]|uniref:DUF6284 family protein n=1 Tax=Kineosporia babensis TaxID=499548 RepID=A0A9X1NLH9_9ACTN|nr:DUF6284 family protein [Kineosporia babensis]MCD5317162.1 DUF6284 family protein [Kineosporia babensis]
MQFGDEPTGTQLRAIEAEWSEIAADQRVLDAEIDLILIEDESPFSRRRMARAVDEWVQAMAARSLLASTPWGDAA